MRRYFAYSQSFAPGAQGQGAFMTAETGTAGPSARAPWFNSAEQISELLRGVGYLADEHACAVLRLADQLGKPVLIEGPTGTGKTDLSGRTAVKRGARLICVPCYEGTR